MVSIKDRKILRQMFSHYNYVMTTAQLSKEKLYYRDIQRMLKAGLIEKVKRGYYHWTMGSGKGDVVIISRLFSGGSKPFDKEQWAAQKQAQRKEAYELIDNTCSEMMISGDSFRQYLDVQGRFDRYSVNNAILVSAQMPEATQLKEKAAWKQSRVYVNLTGFPSFVCPNLLLKRILNGR